MTTAEATTPSRYVGLAPFLRLDINGVDLRPIAQAMLTQANESADDANLWLNLSIVMQCLGQQEIGLSMQDQALSMQRLFHLPAQQQPAAMRLLVLMVAGDIAANTPIDCLLEDSDIDLIYYYVATNQPLPMPIPQHDAVMVAISDSDENRVLLAQLESALADWPSPIINTPHNIPTTNRHLASELLGHSPSLLIPPTLRLTRAHLAAASTDETLLATPYPLVVYPIIIRPIDSQAGRDLARLDCAQDLAAYLQGVTRDIDFFIAPFIDYRSPDGLFRKYRIALIDGQPFACHMGISSHWMIHYVNAGMYEDAHKREEEAKFMKEFAHFALHHQAAFAAIYQRTQLDYLCIDCAETPDGQLLIFEIDHTMVVHAMDSIELFPYKAEHMRKVKLAVRDLLQHRIQKFTRN